MKTPPMEPDTTLPRVYSDGSYRRGSGCTFGAVVCDPAGAELAFVYGKGGLRGEHGSMDAEFLALLHGLRLAVHLGLCSVAVFTDLSEIRKAFNGPLWPYTTREFTRKVVAEIEALPTSRPTERTDHARP